MEYRALKRLYSEAALESWFGRLVEDWESAFANDELQEARQLYRAGLIRHVELSPEQAIVHQQIEGEAVYAVIEWEDGRPSVRYSRGESQPGRVLAAAGLYEIEELVADEVAPIEPELVAGEAHAEEDSVPVEPVVEPSPQENAVARPLLLRFDTKADRLRFNAFWVDGVGEEPAFSPHAELNNRERECLISLASKARRAGFKSEGNRAGYGLFDLDRVPYFLRNELPQWKKHYRLELSADVRKLEQGVRRAELEIKAALRDEGLSVGWGARIGEERLDARAFQRLARRKEGTAILPGVGLVRIEGRQRRELREWKQLEHTFPEGRTPRYMLFSLFAGNRARVHMTPEIRAWMDKLEEAEAPLADLPAFLRPYQREGVQWLQRLLESHCNPLLADEMGLGKTLQALTLLQCLPKAEGLADIVVCPASVVPVWMAEAARFYPEVRVRALCSADNFESVGESPDLWVASYTQLRRHERQLDQARLRVAILDEAQFIKNPEARTTQACFRIQAQHRIAMTGTPVENRLADLWSVFRFLMPGLLGTRAQFHRRLEEEGDDGLATLREQIRPFVLRRTKKNVARELPDKVEIDLRCPLSDLQQREYARLAGETLEHFGDDLGAAVTRESMHLFTLLTRLRQVCCDPALLPNVPDDVGYGGKIQSLLDLLQELHENGRKAVIFSQFVGMLERVKTAIRTRYPDLALHELTGQTTDRATPVEAFQSKRGSAVILVSLRAGGTGITLHAADYVFLLDPWWNPAVEEQAVDRVHRIGQRKKVILYRMITPGTIEERVNQLKAEKRDLFNQTVGQMENPAEILRSFGSLKKLLNG